MSKHRRYLGGGLALVVLGLAAVLLLVPSGSWIALDMRRSSLRTTRDGVAAWAASLEQLGVPTSARYRSLTEGAPGGSALALLEPRVTPTPAELAVLLKWVRDGGILIYSPDLRSALLDSIGVELQMARPDGELATGSVTDHPWVRELTGREVENYWVLSPAEDRSSPWVALTRFGEPGTDQASLAWAPEGRGGILLLSEAEDVSNGRLGSSVVAIGATSAILMLGADTVEFSEFHQGLDRRRGIFRESIAIVGSSAWGPLLLHGALIGSLLLVLAGRRFGAPLPERSISRRSPLEHVEALARIYRAAGSRRAVASRLIRGAERQMRITQSGPPVSGADLLRRWAGRPALAEPAGAALKALHTEPVDLAGLSRALDAVVSAHGRSGASNPRTR